MTVITVVEGQTTAMEAELPRDLSQADTITYHVLGDTDQTAAPSIVDATSGIVAIPFNTLSLSPGTYPVEFTIEYGNGTVDKLPRDSYDVLHVRPSEADA